MSELIERIAESLNKINLPSLRRPSIGPNEAATLELMRFDLCYYAYSVVAYVRDLFAGLTVLSASRNGACGDVIGRCLYEWSMQASYVLLRTREPLGNSDIAAARSVLERLELANDWIRDHGEKYWAAPDQEDIPKNVRRSNFREAFGEYSLATLKEDNTKDDYGYLKSTRTSQQRLLA